MAIYIVQMGSDGPVKIGFSKRPHVRIRSLSVSSPADLKVIAIIKGDTFTEAELHKRFEYAHIKGEWFKPVPELVNFDSTWESVSQDRRAQMASMVANGVSVHYVAEHFSVKRNVVRAACAEHGVTPQLTKPTILDVTDADKRHRFKKGESRPHSIETARKIGASNRGKKRSDESRKRLSEARKLFYHKRLKAIDLIKNGLSDKQVADSLDLMLRSVEIIRRQVYAMTT
jgi:hypothetical protein